MLRTFLKIILIAILLGLIPAVWYLVDLPDTSQLRARNPRSSAIENYREDQIRARGGKPHSVMTWRSLDEISPNLVHAVLLAEDDSFFQHHGFDFAQIKWATETNWERKKFAFGGSTLTQQLARSLYLSPRKNLLRKAKEALITRRLEKSLPKKRILELYLNVVEWGPQVYGAEAASQHFYQKPAADLTPEEAISLAAILPSPRRWNPLGSTRFMNQRRIILHDRMVRAHFLPPDVSSGTVETPVPDQPLPQASVEPSSEPVSGAEINPDENSAPGDSDER